MNANDDCTEHWQMDVRIASTCFFFTKREANREFMKVFSVTTSPLDQ